MNITNRAALASNLDFLATDDPAIPILTVHQSKRRLILNSYQTNDWGRITQFHGHYPEFR